MTSGWLAASAVSLLVLSWLLARLRRHRRRSPAPILILDGGMGLELKQRKAEGLPVAYDLKLFSTAALRETPDAIREIHRDYIRAGVNVITTASYAITRHYLDKIGEGARVEELAALSVRLAKEARAAENLDSSRVLVAASIPPLGESYQAAALAMEELRDQYATLVRGLRGCDVYLCETMGTLAEGLVAVEACEAAIPAARVWLSLTPRRAYRSEGGEQGGVRVSADGATIRSCVEAAVAARVEAILFNCATPELIGAAIAEAVHFAGGRVRVGGYANFWEETERSGWSIEQNETASGAGNQKTGGMVVRHDLSDEEYACHVCGWLCSGAGIVGGCCGIRPATMQVVVANSLAGSRTLSGI